MDLESRVEEFFRRSEAQDWDGLAALCAPGARVKQNIADEGDVASLLTMTRGLAAAGITVRYEDVRRVVAVDAVVEQHVVRLTRGDGVEAAGDVCVVFRFDDEGMITRLDEYVDSAAFAPLFT